MDDPLQDQILAKMHEVGGKKYMTISATIISRELAEMMRTAEVRAAMAVKEAFVVGLWRMADRMEPETAAQYHTVYALDDISKLTEEKLRAIIEKARVK